MADCKWGTVKECAFIDGLGTKGSEIPGSVGFTRLELLKGYERAMRVRDRLDGIDLAVVLDHVRGAIQQALGAEKASRGRRVRGAIA